MHQGKALPHKDLAGTTTAAIVVVICFGIRSGLPIRTAVCAHPLGNDLATRCLGPPREAGGFTDPELQLRIVCTFGDNRRDFLAQEESEQVTHCSLHLMACYELIAYSTLKHRIDSDHH